MFICIGVGTRELSATGYLQTHDVSFAGLDEDTHSASEAQPSCNYICIKRSLDHRNVAELDWCYVASSGKICAVNVSKLLVSTNIELLLGICQKFV